MNAIRETAGELNSLHGGSKGFEGDFYIVQSTGGLFPVEHAKVGCVRMLESGPAAGVIGAAAVFATLALWTFGTLMTEAAPRVAKEA